MDTVVCILETTSNDWIHSARALATTVAMTTTIALQYLSDLNGRPLISLETWGNEKSLK